MRRAAIRCTICGASCRCQNARNGICCACHPHPGRSARTRLLEMRARRLDVGEGDSGPVPPSWLEDEIAGRAGA